MGPRRAVAVVATVLITTTTPAGAGPAAGGSAEWTWPLGLAQTVIVRSFDLPDEPWRPGHRGVDLAGFEDSAVYAAGDGVVTYAGLVAGVGVVTITHGELRTTYQPVTAAVRVGQRVAAGEQIGTLDADRSHCAPSACLHWGLLRGDGYLDPTSLVTPAGRPRLLPLGSRALGDNGDQSIVDATAAEPAEPIPRRPAGVSGQAAMGALAGIRG
ncbi:MAG TPA: M23 family metallopeptidase [Jiangellales bacterium]|nr:M23 family metallopeptidase [Jiangellales bacterium]